MKIFTVLAIAFITGCWFYQIGLALEGNPVWAALILDPLLILLNILSYRTLALAESRRPTR